MEAWRAHDPAMRGRLRLLGGSCLAVIVATMPGVSEPAVPALPYPSAWPVRGSAACAAIVGHYQNQAVGVEDAGQRMQALRLSDLLGVSRVTSGSPALETPGDTGASTSAEHTAEATLAPGRERVTISLDADGRLRVTVDGASATASSIGQCRAHGKGEPIVQIDAQVLEGGQAADAPLSHLARIGIRQVETELVSAAGGDLIVRLRVTKRFGREESFGYPATKQYWWRFARTDASSD